jgi:hypothetical protein
MKSSYGSAMRTDIMRMVKGAVEISKLVRNNKYDEHILKI